jgi:hypothetical protein
VAGGSKVEEAASEVAGTSGAFVVAAALDAVDETVTVTASLDWVVSVLALGWVALGVPKDELIELPLAALLPVTDADADAEAEADVAAELAIGAREELNSEAFIDCKVPSVISPRSKV